MPRKPIASTASSTARSTVLATFAPFAAFAGLIAACGTSSGSSSGGTTTPSVTNLSGSVGGHAVVAANAVGLAGTDSSSGLPYAGAIVLNVSGVCSLLQSGATAPANSVLVAIEVHNVASSAPVGAGTYSVGLSADNNSETSVQVVASDASCSETTNVSASAGSVTVDSVTSSAVSGHFSVTFPAGDQLSGTFEGPLCDVDLSALGSKGPGACDGGAGQ